MHTHIEIGQFYQIKDTIPVTVSKKKFAEYYQLCEKFVELITNRVILKLTPLDTDISYDSAHFDYLIEEKKLLEVFELVKDSKLIKDLLEVKLVMDIEKIEIDTHDITKKINLS